MRGKRWRRVLDVILGIAILIVVAWLSAYLYLGHAVKVKVAELRAQGQPVTAAEAAPRPVSESENAAALYLSVVPTNLGANESSLPEPLAGMSQEEQEFLDAYRRQPASAEADARAAAILERPEVRRVLATLEEASRRPRCVFPIDWGREPFAGVQVTADMIRPVAGLRRLCLLLGQRAILSAHQGRTDDAAHWIAVGLRMTRHSLAASPTLLGELVAIVLQSILLKDARVVLDAGQVSAAGAKELDSALADLNWREAWQRLLPVERAIGLEALQARQGGVRWLINKPYRDYNTLVMVDGMERMIDAARYPSPEGRRRTEAAAPGWKEVALGRRTSGTLGLMALEPMPGAMEKSDYAAADNELCRVVLALKGYKAAHQGYPATLTDLQKALPWTIGADPFSGRPYVYRAEGAGFAIYSVGPDGKDDGGAALRFDQASGGQVGDIVWRCGR